MTLPKAAWFDDDGALPDNPEGTEETRTNILARYTADDIKASGRRPATEGAGFFTLYELSSGYIPCPYCRHPVEKNFYTCGDSQCCYGCSDDRWYRKDGKEFSLLCDCMYSARNDECGYGRRLDFEPDVFIRVTDGKWSPKVVGVIEDAE